MARRPRKTHNEREGFANGQPFFLKYQGFTARYTPIILYDTTMDCRKEVKHGEDGNWVVVNERLEGISYDIKDSRFYYE